MPARGPSPGFPGAPDLPTAGAAGTEDCPSCFGGGGGVTLRAAAEVAGASIHDFAKNRIRSGRSILFDADGLDEARDAASP